MHNIRHIVSFIALLLVACGGDETNGKVGPNNTSANNNDGTVNNTVNNDTTAPNTTNSTTAPNNTNSTTAPNNPNNTTAPNNPNNTPLNNMNPGVEVMEVEPNDDVATATRFEPNDTLVGTTADNDNDFWAVDLVAGSVLEIELTEVQLVGTMYVDLVDPTGDVPERTVGGDEGDTRQFFIPSSGTWIVRLTDLTTGFTNYEITTRVLTPNVSTDYEPPGFLDGDLNDYAVDIYSYTAGSDATVRAGVTADRSPVLSDMDAMLIVYSPGRGLIALNDDADAMTVDPEVTYEQASGRTYWIVVDAVYLAPGGDNSYTLASELQ